MENRQLKELRAQAHAMRPTIQVGKQGVTDELLDEIKLQAKKHRLVKIKILRPALESISKDDLISLITERTHTEIISKTGLTLVIYRRR